MVLLLGVVGAVISSIFIAQVVEKNNWMNEAMRIEQVTLSLEETTAAKGEVADTSKPFYSKSEFSK